RTDYGAGTDRSPERHLQPGGGAVRNADRRAAFSRPGAPGAPASGPRGAALAPPPERYNSPRPGNDLPVLLAKGAGQALCQCGGTGGGLAPFRGRGTDPGPADPLMGARRQMGSPPTCGRGLAGLYRLGYGAGLRRGHLAMARSGNGARNAGNKPLLQA